jgi:hypothetical protein
MEPLTNLHFLCDSQGTRFRKEKRGAGNTLLDYIT